MEKPRLLLRWTAAVGNAFVVADGYANATAARVALERPAAVMGIALSHACLSLDMEGERAPMNRAVWEGMRQLLRKDHREFIRHGIVQLTRGSVDDQVAAFPEARVVRTPGGSADAGSVLAGDT